MAYLTRTSVGPGIGKSRLVQGLKDQPSQDGATRIAFQCSPYHQR